MRWCVLLLVAMLVTSAWARDIHTLDGVVYRDAKVTKVSAEGIQIKHAEGTTFIDFSDLPEELRREFAYDPVAYEELVSGATPVAESTAAEAAPSPAPPRLSAPIKVGELATLDGALFHEAEVVDVTPMGLKVRHRDGVAFLDFAEVPIATRQRFHYRASDYVEAIRARRTRDEQQKKLTEARIVKERAQATAAAALAAQRLARIFASTPPPRPQPTWHQQKVAEAASLLHPPAQAAETHASYSGRSYATDRYQSTGRVHVSGHFRNGRYVRPYTRSR